MRIENNNRESGLKQGSVKPLNYTKARNLLEISCAKLDSQHFWDQMDELPVSAIPKIEEEFVKRVIENENISLDTLLLDATNFFTFINTTNDRTYQAFS